MIVAIPAAAATAWYASWRDRLASTKVPAPVTSSLLFADLHDLQQRLDRQVDRVSALPDSSRVRLAGDLITMLMLADQLDDIQAAVDILLPHMKQRGSPAPDGNADAGTDDRLSRWVYEALGADAHVCSFVPENVDGAEDLRTWAEARRAARYGTTPENIPPRAGHALPPDSLITPPLALRAAWLREAGLAAALAGNAQGGVELLRMVEAPYSGTRLFEDPLASGPNGWAYRLLWYPDTNLPGDLAAIMRRILLVPAEKVWLSLLPRDGCYDTAFGRPDRPILFEVQLRWLLAAAHHKQGNSDWFRRHFESIGGGPLYTHRWVRILAAQHTGMSFTEPDDSDFHHVRDRLLSIRRGAHTESIEAYADSILLLGDRLALAQLESPEMVFHTLQGLEGRCVRDGLEPILMQLGGDLHSRPGYHAIARSISAGFALDDYTADRWLDPFHYEGLAGRRSLGQSAHWLTLLPARVHASRALGRLATLQNLTEESIPALSEMGFRRERAWHTGPSFFRSGVSLSGYVPGLQYIHSLFASVVHQGATHGVVY